jgi:sugar (pentulose or hexulose) kinase
MQCNRLVRAGYSQDTNVRRLTLCDSRPDTRTKGLVRELKDRKGSDELLQMCGLPLSTYPSSVKLRWLLDHNDDVRKAYDENRLSFGTIDSWILYNLNGGKEAGVHVTDTTNASRTMFMNLYVILCMLLLKRQSPLMQLQAHRSVRRQALGVLRNRP